MDWSIAKNYFKNIKMRKYSLQMSVALTIIIVTLIYLFASCAPEENIKYIPKTIVNEDVLAKLVNDARVDKGLNTLQSETLLIELCKSKAIQMESQQSINHNGFTNLETHTETFGQIVGFGYKTDLSLFNAYLRSNEHNHIIYGNYTHIGTYNYKTYNCVLFAKY